MRLLEITLKSRDDFLKVAETLRRIGHVEAKNKTLQQPVYVLHKTGQYYIVHYTEMLVLDGVLKEVPEDGFAVRNTIARVLQDWNLLQIVRPEWAEKPSVNISDLKIIPHRDKHLWRLVPIYEIGKNRK